MSNENMSIAESRGWTLMEETDRFGNRFYKNGDKIARAGDFPTRCDPLPDYFRDPAAAVSLCEAMAKEEPIVNVTFNNQRVIARWGECVAISKSFPAAVAECYGKAMGLWK